MAVVGSALWAAAGDALGWITELGDEETVYYRTGKRSVEGTVEWKRRIGGRFGPTVTLPAGTYSDDTQLRLSVSRAIRGTGEFDAEAFAKVELPVWLSYSLGGGRGTTAAAANLAKSSVTWFSNFFSSRDSRGYFTAGGNGAAMRVQPHVWKSKTLHFGEFAGDVLKDAIITHGHPIGFCGAVFHALSLAYALENRELPSANKWKEFVDELRNLPKIVKEDEQLSLFWLKPWEERFGDTFQSAVAIEADRTVSLISQVQPILNGGAKEYRSLLNALGAFEEATRGSGTNTAIAAACLASFGRDITPEKVMLLGANAIGSDTDTISSMAGAILGAVCRSEPKWKLQDRNYLASEAERLAGIASGAQSASFPYPDLMSWSPPSTQGDAVGLRDNSLWLAGLGRAEALGNVWGTSEADWQWLKLEFGQTVLAKRRSKPRTLSTDDLPVDRSHARSVDDRRGTREPSLFTQEPLQRSGGPMARSEVPVSKAGSNRTTPINTGQAVRSIDDLTDWVIEENFKPDVVGRAFLLAAQGPHAVDRSIALAAVVAKAVDARRRKAGK
ncbi:MAG: ADP-ribosylglycohydrolase family protein [Candidatus Acidiferrales bacterium]